MNIRTPRAPPRHTRPWRSRTFDSRCRARVRSATRSARARHRSRTASSARVGMGEGGDADTDQLPGAVQPGQPPAVTLVGLDLVTRRPGDQRRCDHLATHAETVEQPGQLEAGRAGLVAGSQPSGVTKAANEPAHRRLVVGMRSTLGICWSGAKIPTEMCRGGRRAQGGLGRAARH
jgi:hypothetical protein